MGNCTSTSDRQAKAHSDAIDKDIEQDSKKFRKECKILLLGELGYRVYSSDVVDWAGTAGSRCRFSVGDGCDGDLFSVKSAKINMKITRPSHLPLTHPLITSTR